MNDYLSFGYWMRRRRKALDLTQTELARLVFCSLSTIKKIESDERRPSIQMADRLAECLQVPSSERKAFLAAAGAELAFDQLNPIVDPPITKPAVSNLRSYQPPTPFIGYREELAQISNLIQQRGNRLIALVGPGGTGKTRLAFQAASNQLGNFMDGVFFVPLAQLDAPAYIIPAILDALALQKPAISDLRAYLLEYLHDKTMLLVLDNFEQLLTGIDLLVEISRIAPAVVLLVTSRVPLNLRLEQVFEVKGMKIPLGENPGDYEAYDAVQLYIQTAKRVSSGFEVDDNNLRSIVNICKFVEGMPLAIELAASWSRTRSCVEIEREIEHGLDLLTSKMADVPERHRSIRAAFDLSWNLLSDEERRVFSVLSIFQGGFHRQAAEAIAMADETTLGSLVSKSLLRRANANRYDMHELLYRYSTEKLTDPVEINRLRDAHLSYYLSLAEDPESERNATQDTDRFPTIENELPNFRAALQWAVDARAQERGLRLAIALGSFWHDNGYLREGMYWLSQVLEIDTCQYPSYRAAALIQSAILAQAMGNFRQATLLNKGSLSICRELKDKRGIGLSLLNLGIVRYLNGEYERGIRFLKKSLSIFQEIDDEKYQGQALIRIADWHMRRGMLEQASSLWQQALAISSKLDNKQGIAFSLGGLGDIKRLQGKYQEAIDLQRKSLKIHWEQNNKLDIPFLLEALGLNYAALGQERQATVLWGAAESLREKTHSPLPPSYQASYAPIITEIRNSQGETNFTQAWEEGKSTPLERIINGTLYLTG